MKTLDELKQTPNLLIKFIVFDGGWGMVKFGKLEASVIWSNGGGWEHVSIAPYKRSYIPSWEDMCKVKDMFWHDDEAVIQIHPAKKDYVNNLPNCLHLWRPLNEPLPLPPTIMVGLKKEDTDESVRKSIDEIMSS